MYKRITENELDELFPTEVGVQALKEKHSMNPDGPCSCLQHRTENCTDCFDTSTWAGPEHKFKCATKAATYDERVCLRNNHICEICLQPRRSSLHSKGHGPALVDDTPATKAQESSPLGQLMPMLVDEDAMAPHDKTWMLDGPQVQNVVVPVVLSVTEKLRTETAGPGSKEKIEAEIKASFYDLVQSIKRLERMVIAAL